MYIDTRTYNESRTKAERLSKRSRSTRREILERCAIVGLIIVAIVFVSVMSISKEFSRKSEQVEKVELRTSDLPESADLDKAMQFLADNDHGAASASFTRALTINKNSVEALVGRGVANAKSGDLSKAEADFLAAARLSQNASAVFMNLANVKDLKSDFLGAIENYTKALSLDPSLLVAYGNRARCSFRNGQYSQALDDLSHVIRLDTRNPVAYLNRAITLARLSRFDAAVTNLSHPALQGSATPETRKLAAFLQLQSGDADDSLRTSRRGLEQNPNDAEFRLLSIAAMKVLADLDPGLSSEAKDAWVAARDELGDEYKSLVFSHAELTSIATAFQAAGCCSPQWMLLNEGVSLSVPISKKAAAEQALQAIDFLKVGDLETAVACLRESLRNAPGEKDTTIKLVMTLVDQGRIEHAVEELKPIANRSIKDKKVFGLLSMLYSRLGNFREATAALDRAISIDNADPELYLLRANVKSLEGDNHKQVFEDCQRAERLGLNSASLLGIKANALKELGERELSIEAFTRAIEIDPKNVSSLINRSEAYRSFGQPENAIADARTAAKIDSTNADVFYEISLCFSDLQLNDKALRSIDEALRLAPMRSHFRIQKGRVLMSSKEYPGAIASFGMADQKLLSKEDHHAMACCYFEVKDFENAWLSASNALDMGKPSHEIMSIAGRVAFVREDFARANALLEKSVELGGGTADVYCLLGKCASQRRDFESALKYFRKSLNLEGNTAPADTWFASGNAFEKDGKGLQAVECYGKSLEIDGTNPAVRHARARALVTLHNYRTAMDDLKWLLSNDANDEAAAQMVKLCKTKLVRSR